MATLLEIVQEFCRRTGTRVPPFVAGSTDSGVLQYMALLSEVCTYIVDEGHWNELIREATFTTVDGEDQGALTTLAPNGFLGIVNRTIFDRTQKVPLYGPMSPQDWQQEKAFVPSGPLYSYRIRGGRLLFMPAAEAGHSCAFEYYSDFFIYNPVDDVYKRYFTKDTDEFLLDEKLALLGLRAVWKKEKGMAYAEDYDQFVRSVANSAARNGTKPTISMNDDTDVYVGPGIIIPPGSWNV